MLQVLRNVDPVYIRYSYGMEMLGKTDQSCISYVWAVMHCRQWT